MSETEPTIIQKEVEGIKISESLEILFKRQGNAFGRNERDRN